MPGWANVVVLNSLKNKGKKSKEREGKLGIDEGRSIYAYRM